MRSKEVVESGEYDIQNQDIHPHLMLGNDGLWLRLVIKNNGLRREHVDLLMAEYLAREPACVADLWKMSGLNEGVVEKDLIFKHYSFNYKKNSIPKASMDDIYSYCISGILQRDTKAYRVDPAFGNFGFEVLESFFHTPMGRQIDEINFNLFSHTIEHNRKLFTRQHLILASQNDRQSPLIKWFG